MQKGKGRQHRQRGGGVRKKKMSESFLGGCHGWISTWKCSINICWMNLPKSKGHLPDKCVWCCGMYTVVSQPQHYWHFGPNNSATVTVPCIVGVSGILYPLDASSVPAFPPHHCNNQKCLQTLPYVPWVQITPGWDSLVNDKPSSIHVLNKSDSCI